MSPGQCFPNVAMVALALALGGTALWSPDAWAGGHSRLTKGDARAAAVGRLWRCVRGKRCASRKVFRGRALKEWPRAQRKLRQITVLDTALVKKLPAGYGAKLKRRWGRHLPALSKAGHRTAALARLGQGKAIVTLKPRVALALTSLKMQRRGRVKTEHLFLVLWKVKGRWYVAHLEDSPGSIARFLIGHTP